MNLFLHFHTHEGNSSMKNAFEMEEKLVEYIFLRARKRKVFEFIAGTVFMKYQKENKSKF